MGFVLKGAALFRASTLLAAIGFLLFGYDQGVMSGVVANDLFLNTMGNPDSALVGAIVALYEIGCMFGALSTGRIGDWLGRRKTIRLGCLILCIGAILQTAAVNAGMMIVARIITGVGNGMNTATIPVYQAELSPPKSRGSHVAFEASLLTIGVAVAYWLEYGLYFVQGEFAWRFPLAFQMVFAIILGLASFILPESPRWLQAHGHEEECKKVLARLWSDCDTTHPRCIAEWEEIRDGIELERREGISSYVELFKKGKMNNRYRVLLGMGGQLIQQFGGINVISYYLADVFKQAGMSTEKAMLMAGVDSFVYFAGAVTPIFTIERLGRRWLMYAGLIGQAITLLIVGGGEYIVQRDQALYGTLNGPASKAVIAFVMLYTFVFGAAWLGLAWLYPSEIFSTGLRAKGNSMSTAANWLGNFVVAMIAPVLFEYAKYWTFLMFGILNVIFLIPIYFFYPETMGKSLEEIEVLFATEDLQEDAKSIASHIGSVSLYEKTHGDAESGRGSRPQSRRFPSNFSGRQSVMSANKANDKPAVDSEAAHVKNDYDEKGPNYK
ncbi:general substrate transporter [Rhizopus microsporus var. microsporus]|uniref:General substrate transporter n=2 Tax=Rhizopus microsporus TaxID=58291 RepID=A0A2G4SRK1_RHIZD|nr:general substrate transporter [Rhizopus microsporus ATCC 52813]ORE08852.1 general substrate transporter [Rhizopus microsporus var. microsporus]PHZ11016.1 general substrate transporter [Rhizopus microsporus ATCC 52813]